MKQLESLPSGADITARQQTAGKHASLVHWLWNFSIPDLGRRHRIWIDAFVVLLLIGVAYPALQAIFGDIGTNGNEILDKPSPATLIAQNFHGVMESASPFRRWGVAALAVVFACSVFVQIYLTFLGYSRFEREFGKPFPSHEIITFMATSTLMTIVVPLALAILGALSWLLLGSFAVGWEWLGRMGALASSFIEAVPTLVTIPYPLPLILVGILSGFSVYWIHRWGHTTRLGWLLFHRNHHMAPHLLTPVAGPVFATFPLMFIVAIPYGVLNGVATKVFTPEPMILESMLLSGVLSLTHPFSHCSALYRMGRNNRWLYYFQALNGNGVFHYMHHSALPGHEICNIGGGWFNCWDRVFKTYHSPHRNKPPVGLTGQPELYMNPFRLAFGGLLQLLYEWRHNRDWATRFKIVFGPSSFTPPSTRKYILAEE